MTIAWSVRVDPDKLRFVIPWEDVDGWPVHGSDGATQDVLARDLPAKQHALDLTSRWRRGRACWDVLGLGAATAGTGS